MQTARIGERWPPDVVSRAAEEWERACAETEVLHARRVAVGVQVVVASVEAIMEGWGYRRTNRLCGRRLIVALLCEPALLRLRCCGSDVRAKQAESLPRIVQSLLAGLARRHEQALTRAEMAVAVGGRRRLEARTDGVRVVR